MGGSSSSQRRKRLGFVLPTAGSFFSCCGNRRLNAFTTCSVISPPNHAQNQIIYYQTPHIFQIFCSYLLLGWKHYTILTFATIGVLLLSPAFSRTSCGNKKPGTRARNPSISCKAWLSGTIKCAAPCTLSS